ncbi:ubiquitin-like small modifier protein 1 [Natrinema longum]|uniref:ubiquitin-like small modifier protein 1 n=1 Tax=Natrinema longum TaxID=370324 RepID=UPI001CC9B21C|nr:MoaD/ThiS family protein [Natrinema longum]
MDITVRLFAMYRAEVGRKSISITVPSEATVREALETVEASYPALSRRLLTPDGETKQAISILLNGRLVTGKDGLETSLSEDDILSVMPPVTGGIDSNVRSLVPPRTKQ